MSNTDKQPFDIANLDVTTHSEEGMDVEIINPRTGEKIGLVITVKGAFSARFQELVARQKKRDAIRKNNPVARAVADEDDDTAQVLSEVTIGWKGMVENGKEVVFSKAEAFRVYDKYPIIRGQVLTAALDVANFIKD